MTILKLAGISLASALALAVGLSAPALAQDYPNKPIRVILPISAGSVTDTLLRAASDQLAATLGQPLVIDNRPGAATIIGGAECANSAPDGYTICLVTHSTLSLNPLLFSNLPYDPAKDFVPITQLYFIGEALLVPTSLGVNSVAELEAVAKKDGSTLNLGTLGAGSTPELFLRWLNDRWSSSIAPIPYPGGGDVVQALSQGEIQIGKIGAGNYLPIKDQGKVKALAVALPARSPLMPDVPTFEEAGFGDFNGSTFWAVVAPAGTPEPILDKLHAAFDSLNDDAVYTERLINSAMLPARTTREEFAQFLVDYDVSARELLKLAKIEPKAYEPK